jgi:taurine dioxygenase
VPRILRPLKEASKHVTSTLTATEPVIYKRITVTKVTPTIGAEVTGVSLADVDEETFGEIHDAFLRHKVLFFRDQTNFLPHHHESLALRFGELDPTPKALKTCDDAPHVAIIETSSENKPYVDYWHTDLAYKKRPALVSILRSRVIPEVGGDTLWVDMEAAYDALSDDMKERLADLKTHNSYAKLVDFGPVPAAVIEERLREWPPVEHPIVRTHHETGRKSIYSSINTATHVPGLSSEESDAMLDFLYRLSDKPEHQVRLKWTPDTVAMWDNRNTRHYATADYYPERRMMERAIVTGEEPV